MTDLIIKLINAVFKLKNVLFIIKIIFFWFLNYLIFNFKLLFVLIHNSIMLFTNIFLCTKLLKNKIIYPENKNI